MWERSRGLSSSVWFVASKAGQLTESPRGQAGRCGFRFRIYQSVDGPVYRAKDRWSVLIPDGWEGKRLCELCCVLPWRTFY